jgi:hypothetical protein
MPVALLPDRLLLMEALRRPHPLPVAAVPTNHASRTRWSIQPEAIPSRFVPSRSYLGLVADRGSSLVLAIAWSLLIAASLAGCSARSADCNVVRLQREAGRSDADIAKAIGSSERAVRKCQGTQSTMMQPAK